MKQFYLIVCVILSSQILNAQCSGSRYTDFTFPDFELTSDVQYGSNVDVNGDPIDLMMDVYEPSGDTEVNRPLIVVCHGGYFLGGDKTEVDVASMCQDFAKMGYVVASINYRVGIPISIPLQGPYGQAVVRAVQDLRAAIRWFRKNAAEDGNTYNIDTSLIFVGGDSAGGFMALHHAYMDESEIPAWLEMNGTGMEGGMDGESGNPGYSSDVVALYSVSGALGDENWIDETDTTPATLFHGDNDEVVTIDAGMFVLFGLLEVTEISGGNPIDQRMTEMNIEHCYEINEGLGHVPYLSSDAVYDTTIAKISRFFSHFICDTQVDCEYYPLSNSITETENAKLKFYPNPVECGELITTDKSFKNSLLEIFDLTGKKIFSYQLTGNRFRIPENLNDGIYFVSILEENNTWSERILVGMK